MSDIKLDTIRGEIKAKGAEWNAGTTSLSTMSSAEQNARLGLIPNAAQLATIKRLGLDTQLSSGYFEKQMTHASRSAGIPNRIDWREVSGSNWITPIKNQGGCGSCVAHGTLGALEALLRINFYKDSNRDIELCRAHLLWCGGGSCKGWNMDAACDYLKANGVPDEQCLPYKPEKMKCSDTCPDWKDRVDTTKILDWAKTIDVNAMKTNLVENGPQITGMAVYNDFFSYSSGVYRHVTGDLAGYHCITAVGFDDDEECWICKNSWGEDWGETGFFKIGYGECGIDDVFGMWDMKVPAREPDGVKEGYADQISIEYSCESSVRVLNAYAGGEWRQCQKTDADLMEIAKLAFGASKVYVGWKGSQLIFMRCFKSG